MKETNIETKYSFFATGGKLTLKAIGNPFRVDQVANASEGSTLRIVEDSHVPIWYKKLKNKWIKTDVEKLLEEWEVSLS